MSERKAPSVPPTIQRTRTMGRLPLRNLYYEWDLRRSEAAPLSYQQPTTPPGYHQPTCSPTLNLGLTTPPGDQSLSRSAKEQAPHFGRGSDGLPPTGPFSESQFSFQHKTGLLVYYYSCLSRRSRRNGAISYSSHLSVLSNASAGSNNLEDCYKRVDSN